MTVQAVFESGVSGDAFRAFYALQSQEGEFNRGIGGLAEVLGWSDRKTSRVLKELEEGNIVRVERRYKAPARICVYGVRDGSVGSAEPAPDNRSDGLRGSCSDSDFDSVCTVQDSQSESEAFDSADLAGLRARLEALAFRGVSWALRTFEPSVLDETLTIVEGLAAEGLSYNPGGLVNSALRGKVVLFRPEKASETAQEPSRHPTPDTGGVVSGPETTAQRLREYLAEIDRYPADHGKQRVPDTYHAPEPDKEYVDPAIGVEKLKAGLKGTRTAA